MSFDPEVFDGSSFGPTSQGVESQSSSVRRGGNGGRSAMRKPKMKADEPPSNRAALIRWMQRSRRA